MEKMEANRQVAKKAKREEVLHPLPNPLPSRERANQFSLNSLASSATWRLISLLFFFLLFNGSAHAFQNTGEVEVYFSPKGGATSAIVTEINLAAKQIQIQAYSFTSRPIGKALIDAKRRGVAVTFIIDGGQLKGRYNPAVFLRNSGIPVYLDKRHSIAHNKVIIIDNRVLITGSFNFTKAAERENAENLLIFRNNFPLVEMYAQNFRDHLSHSERF
jgi:phosphatidylserine/phosphatidylglycerophosphate/cardiolipin synthase-like enzyme